MSRFIYSLIVECSERDDSLSKLLGGFGEALLKEGKTVSLNTLVTADDDTRQPTLTMESP